MLTQMLCKMKERMGFCAGFPFWTRRAGDTHALFLAFLMLRQQHGPYWYLQQLEAMAAAALRLPNLYYGSFVARDRLFALSQGASLDKLPAPGCPRTHTAREPWLVAIHSSVELVTYRRYNPLSLKMPFF